VYKREEEGVERADTVRERERERERIIKRTIFGHTTE
jgi:hypothetical protein